MKRALFTWLALCAGLLIGVPPGPAQAQTLSPSCQKANDAGFDDIYASNAYFFVSDFFAGERLTVSAGTPTSYGTPTTLTLSVDGTVVGTTAFPGALSYVFPEDTQGAVFWWIDGFGNATWTVSCELGRPTSREQCKAGGWEAFGFRNQGACVSFVATGR